MDKKYEKKKKDLASKMGGMPDPVVKKNLTKADKETELPCKTCGSKSHKTGEHKK